MRRLRQALSTGHPPSSPQTSPQRHTPLKQTEASCPMADRSGYRMCWRRGGRTRRRVLKLYPRSSGGGASSGGGSISGRTRPRWSPSTSSVTYTPAEMRALTPVRRTVELRARQEPDLCDVFLCHAWDDRRGAATELHDLLEAEGVSVWFSESDIVLGYPFMREIDRGLAKSRTGLVLVTPALLKRVDSRGISDKELSELVRRDQLIPVMHETTYEELEKVSPLLASRNGLNTADDSMADIATKIAELVAVEDDLTAPLTSAN